MNTRKGHIANYWSRCSSNHIICNLCPRHCKLSDGQKGFCLIRQNIDGQLILSEYGKIQGLSIDPVEKKPLYHFFPGTDVLSFGTIGCNLNCQFCQNWTLSRATSSRTGDEYFSPEDIVALAKKHKCKSIAFTYNEPIIFAEYVIDVAKECKKSGIKTIAVTAGYITKEARTDFFKNIDAVNIDLKSFSDSFYKEFTSSDINTVLDTILYIKKTNIWMEITNLVIPGLNDSNDEINNLTNWVLDNLGDSIPIHFSAFHPDFNMTDRPATPKETLINARRIAKSKGLKYVYTGNILDEEGSTTFCHNCKKPLILRHYYEIIENKLLNTNFCPDCKTECSGYFL